MASFSGEGSATRTKPNDMVKERYTLYRGEGGKRLPFETADFRPLKSPYDLSTIAQVGFLSEAQALENLAIAKRAFHAKSKPKAHERIAILKRAASRVAERREAFADLIAWEGGKPLKDARIEVDRAVSSLNLAADEAGRMHGEEVPMRATPAASGHVAFTYPEPIGVVFAISAFNHPLNLIAHQIGPAIAVGCPVLVKPASETPLSCLHLLDVLHESGLPAEMALPLLVENDVAEKIARSPDIAFLTFIGSARVGWHLRSVLAPGTRLSLEHGGSAPVLVDADADLDLALPTILKAGYYHAGQVCVSTQRIFVHEDIMPEFSERFVALVRALKTGDPRVDTTDCGPIIRGRDMERIHETVSQAVLDGAELLTGGKPLGKTTFEPTVVSKAPLQGSLMQDEIFGPVTALQTFREIEDGARLANDVDWVFQSAYFGRDLERALEATRLLNASAVMVNEGTAFRVDWMPFRGDGPSGFGTGGIPFAMRDMTRDKLVVIKSPHFAL